MNKHHEHHIHHHKKHHHRLSKHNHENNQHGHTTMHLSKIETKPSRKPSPADESALALKIKNAEKAKRIEVKEQRKMLREGNKSSLSNASMIPEDIKIPKAKNIAKLHLHTKTGDPEVLVELTTKVTRLSIPFAFKAARLEKKDVITFNVNDIKLKDGNTFDKFRKRSNIKELTENYQKKEFILQYLEEQGASKSKSR